MGSGSKGEILKSKTDSCGMCGKSCSKLVTVHRERKVDSWEMHKDDEGETQHG